MAGGVIGLIPYVRVTGEELVRTLADSDRAEAVAPLIRKALQHRGADLATVVSEADFEFATQVALREHWRLIHGEVDTWDANARQHGVDPRPLEAAVQ